MENQFIFKNAASYLIVFIFSFILGVNFNTQYLKFSNYNTISKITSYNKEVVDLTVPSKDTPGSVNLLNSAFEIKAVTGVISNINKNILLIKSISTASSTVDAKLDRNIVVSTGTKIFIITMNNNIDKNLIKATSSIFPFERKESFLSDVKVGDHVSVKSEVNIKGVKEFKASEIIVNRAMVK